jgi:ribulose-phosphate 3-epimerase
MARLAPSILSCDFSRLKEQLLLTREGGANIIHIDVMDGHFVPNLTFGPLMVEAVRKILPDAFLDVHLMIQNPRQYFQEFISSGADNISFHLEAVSDFDALINSILKTETKASLALCPGTPIEAVFQVLHKLYMVLLLTVNPGFGGQKFIAGMDQKIDRLKKEIQSRGLTTSIEIDGGINEDNIEYLASRGASIIVAGSFVFLQENQIVEKIRELSRKIAPF